MSDAFQPKTVRRFRFIDRSFDPATGRVDLVYGLDERRFIERFSLPPTAAPQGKRAKAIDAALDLLHWMAGISYFKAACPPQMVFEGNLPGEQAASLLTEVYRHGLGEFAFVNNLPEVMHLRFAPGGSAPSPAATVGLSDRSLLPIGGGKDSLLAGDLLSAAGTDYDAVYVGGSKVIARSAQTLQRPVINITRRLDPALFELNELGAYNGHVPITAILSSVLVLLALTGDYNAVVMANEASADEGNQRQIDGVEVNHQWSKSLAFETAFSEYLQQFVARDLDYFSLLRPYNEMAIIHAFAARPHLHVAFTSCNRNFTIRDLKQSRYWCRDCPKCRFVALGLATRLSPNALGAIMGGNLLDDPEQLPGVLSLIGLADGKPFECVGTIAESRAALSYLAGLTDWGQCRVIKAAAQQIERHGVERPALDNLVAQRHQHRVPARFQGALF